MPPSKRVSLLRKIISPNASENGAALLQYRKSLSSIGEERMKDRGLGVCPQKKMFKVTPSRASENALLEEEIEVAIIIDLCAQMKTGRLIRKRKTNKLHSQFLLVSFACNPTLEEKYNASCCK